MMRAQRWESVASRLFVDCTGTLFAGKVVVEDIAQRAIHATTALHGSYSALFSSVLSDSVLPPTTVASMTKRLEAVMQRVTHGMVAVIYAVNGTSAIHELGLQACGDFNSSYEMRVMSNGYGGGMGSSLALSSANASSTDANVELPLGTLPAPWVVNGSEEPTQLVWDCLEAARCEIQNQLLLGRPIKLVVIELVNGTNGLHLNLFYVLELQKMLKHFGIALCVDESLTACRHDCLRGGSACVGIGEEAGKFHAPTSAETVREENACNEYYNNSDAPDAHMLLSQALGIRGIDYIILAKVGGIGVVAASSLAQHHRFCKDNRLEERGSSTGLGMAKLECVINIYTHLLDLHNPNIIQRNRIIRSNLDFTINKLKYSSTCPKQLTWGQGCMLFAYWHHKDLDQITQIRASRWLVTQDVFELCVVDADQGKPQYELFASGTFLNQGRNLVATQRLTDITRDTLSITQTAITQLMGRLPLVLFAVLNQHHNCPDPQVFEDGLVGSSSTRFSDANSFLRHLNTSVWAKCPGLPLSTRPDTEADCFKEVQQLYLAGLKAGVLGRVNRRPGAKEDLLKGRNEWSKTEIVRLKRFKFRHEGAEE